MFLLRFSRPLELLFGLFVLVDIPHLLHPSDITNGGFLKWGIPKTMGFKWFQY